MVAVEAHQDRGTRGQPGDAALVPLDDDMVLRRERLAHREQQTGDEVLDRVAHHDAHREAGEPERAEDAAEKGRRADDLQREDRAGDDDRAAQQHAQEVGDERVRRPAPGEGLPRRDEATDPPEQRDDRDRDQEQRDRRQQVDRLRPQVVGDRREAPLQVALGLQVVLDGEDAVHALDDLDQALPVLRVEHGPRQQHDAAARADLDGVVARQQPEHLAHARLQRVVGGGLVGRHPRRGRVRGRARGRDRGRTRGRGGRREGAGREQERERDGERDCDEAVGGWRGAVHRRRHLTRCPRTTARAP